LFFNSNFRVLHFCFLFSNTKINEHHITGSIPSVGFSNFALTNNGNQICNS
jgi:hypothetical protein